MSWVTKQGCKVTNPGVRSFESQPTCRVSNLQFIAHVQFKFSATFLSSFFDFLISFFFLFFFRGLGY